MPTASRRQPKAYFDHPANDLSLRESAVLATVLNNPTAYDPANGKEAREDLKVRYAYVLDSMAEMEYDHRRRSATRR